MDADAIYEIARYRRGEDSDGLIDRRQIILDGDGSLAVRYADGRQDRCPQRSAGAVIAADPGLHRVDPIEVTHLQGSREVLDELPLLLRVADEGHPPESYEVFVDDEPWDVLDTTDGPRIFPEGYAIADDQTLPDEWLQVRGTDASGAVVGRLGLITPAVVAELIVAGRDDPRLSVEARGDDDADTVTGWLRRGGFAGVLPAPALIALFADTAPGGAAGDWAMAVSLGDEVVRGVLGRVRPPG